MLQARDEDESSLLGGMIFGRVHLRFPNLKQQSIKTTQNHAEHEFQKFSPFGVFVVEMLGHIISHFAFNLECNVRFSSSNKKYNH